MRKIFITLGIFISSIIIIIGVLVAIFSTYTHNYNLSINGELVDDAEIVVHHKGYRINHAFPFFVLEEDTGAEMPLLLLFENFGGEINWENEQKATLMLDGKEYDFILSDEPSIKSKETGEDLLGFVLVGYPSDFPCIYGEKNNEIYYDYQCIDVVFQNLGKNIEINVDHKENMVYVNEVAT